MYQNYTTTPFDNPSGSSNIESTADATSSPKHFWSNTDNRAQSGSNSAYCDQIDEQYGMRTVRTTYVQYDINCAAFMSTLPLAVSSNNDNSLSFDWWSQLDWLNDGEYAWYDYVIVDIVIDRGGEDEWVYEILEIWESPQSWEPFQMDLPYAMPTGAQIVFSFISNSHDTLEDEGKAAEGVYIDNILVEVTNIDLLIASVTASDMASSIDDSVTLTVNVKNAGGASSGPFNVAWWRDPGFAENLPEGEVPVASLAPGEVREISIDVGFPGLSKSDIVTSRIRLRADYLVGNLDGAVIEVNEINNSYFPDVNVSWGLPAAPVILVHGFTGGGLSKDGVQVYGNDLKESLISFFFDTDRIARSTTTNTDIGSAISVPNAYPPENGFMRDPFFDLPVACTVAIPGSIGSEWLAIIGQEQIDRKLEDSVQGMWGALIDSLVGHGYELPDSMPPRDSTGHPQDIFLFNWDWRVDMNPNRVSTNLNGSTHSYAKLDSLIGWIKQYHDAPERLTIVSHSMGGQLVQGYLREQEGDSGVFRWISMGTPFQGTVDAMATFMGASQSGMLVASDFISGYLDDYTVTDIAQRYVSAWEALPTRHFDLAAPEGHGWPGSYPFAYYPNSGPGGDYCTSYHDDGCRRFPIYHLGPNVSMQNILDNPGSYPEWRDHPGARNYAASYQSSYMDMSVANRIDGVDTWLIAGADELTLRGIVQYTKPVYHYDPGTPIEVYRQTMYDLAFGTGDGLVPLWSATTVNVPDSRKNVRYVSVLHMDLTRDAVVGNYIADLIAGAELSHYEPLVRSVVPTEEFSHLWQIVWKTDIARRPVFKSAEKATEIPGTGVVLELVDRNATGANVLVGQVIVDNGGVEKSYAMSFDPRFKLTAIGDQIIIASKTTEDLNLRLIVRPSSSVLWNGSSPPVGKDSKEFGEDVDIQGQLRFYQNSQAWVWPGSAFVDEYGNPVERIAFTNVGNVGFQGYVDLHINNGNLSPGGNFFHIDSDGDGVSDMQVSGVLEGGPGEIPPHRSVVGVTPNPFNPATTISWSLSKGEAEFVAIYDLAGRLVRKFPVGNAKKGELFFDGLSDAGVLVASGTYLVMVYDSQGNVAARQKMSLIR